MNDPSQEIQDAINSFLSTLQNRLPLHGGAIIGIYSPLLETLQPFYWVGAAGPNISITADTVYCIGSCTKTFTATLAGWLQTGCDFPLNNTVGDLLGVPNNPLMAAMTLFSLATHTSGMVRDAGPASGALNLFSGGSVPKELHEWWQQYPDNNVPTTGFWVYSDIGFVTLGWTIMAATTYNYPILLGDVITTPVGLPNTWGVVPSTVPASSIAIGYTGPKDDPQPEPAQNGTDIKSTAADMLTWVKKNLSLVGGGGTSALDQAITLAVSPQIESPEYPNRHPTPFSMGLAWQIAPPGKLGPGVDITIIAKDGGVSRGGCSTWLAIVPPGPDQAPIAFAILINYFDNDFLFQSDAARLLNTVSTIVMKG